MKRSKKPDFNGESKLELEKMHQLSNIKRESQAKKIPVEQLIQAKQKRGSVRRVSSLRDKKRVVPTPFNIDDSEVKRC